MNKYKAHFKQGRTSGFVLATVLTLALVLGMGAYTMAQKAGEPTKPEQSATPTGDQEDTKVNVGGMQVAIDPRTGKLRSLTREEAKALFEGMRKHLSQSTEGLTPVQHPDGSESVDLEGRFESLSVTKVNPDGSVSTKCVTSEKEAAAFLGVDNATTSGAASAKSSSGSPARKTGRTSIKKTRRASR